MISRDKAIQEMIEITYQMRQMEMLESQIRMDGLIEARKAMFAVTDNMFKGVEGIRK